MNDSGQHSPATASEIFLSGAYRRIRRTTIVLSFAAATGALWFGWRAGLGVGIGALVGYLNFVWLHRASVMLTERMAAPAASQPSKFPIILAFAGRYTLVIAVAYVIFKGWPRMLAGFTVALLLPVLAAVGEGIYEAFAGRRKDEL